MAMEIDGAEEQVVLIELRAGLMSMTGGLLQADNRKGLLLVAQTEDTLIHVCWYPRVGATRSGPAERDEVVFPDECSLQQIPNQPRCYVLAFKDDPSRNMFFWMQQLKPEEDTALVTAFNRAVDGLLEAPHQPAPVAAAAAAAPPPPAPPAARPQQNAPGGGGDLASILSAALSAAGAPSSSAPDPIALAASLLQQLAGQYGQQQQRPMDEGPGLHEVLKPELLAPLMQQPGMLEKLAPHLPEEHRSVAQLVATARSPQFQQQLATFSAAMQTGQLDLTQFGLQPKGFSVADFLTAIQEMVDKEKQSGASGSF